MATCTYRPHHNGGVRKHPMDNISSPQNYFQKIFGSVISMFLKSIGTTLEQFVWRYFSRLWDMFLHTGLTEFQTFFMTKSPTFFSSTFFVISRLVLFLIRRQSSEGFLWRSLEASLQLCWKCSVSDIFLETWRKFTEQLF